MTDETPQSSLKPDASTVSEERPVQKIVLPGQSPEGEHILGTLIKRTYDIVPGGRCTRAENDKKLISGDVFYADPMNSTVKFESDFVPYKIATDVVLIGKAYAPGGQPVPMLTVSLRIGETCKELAIIGDRLAGFITKRSAPVFTDPQPFVEMELRYERAYGGVDIFSDPKVACIYPRNHLGRGFAVRNTKRSVDKLPLPNIEDPQNLLTPEGLCPGHFKYWERQPIPQGLGWFLKSWKPRAGFAGIMPADRPAEQEAREIYAQMVPSSQKAMFDQTQIPDMDFRFFNGASDGLALPFLTGDEPVQLTHLDPQGELVFQLPGEKPKMGLDIGEGVQDLEVVLHTVQICLEDKQVDLVWRGATEYPGPEWLTQMKKMDVHVG